MPKGELPSSSPDEILTVVIMKVAIMLKMTMGITMVMLMIGTRALPVRVGKMTMTMVIAMVMMMVTGHYQ